MNNQNVALNIANAKPFNTTRRTELFKTLNLKQRKLLDKKRVKELYLSGLTHTDIHIETGIPINLIKATIKTIDKQILTIDKANLFKLLKGKIVSMMDSHANISGELTRQFTRAVDRSLTDEDSVKDMVLLSKAITDNNVKMVHILTSMGVATPDGNGLLLPPPEGSTDNQIASKSVLEVDSVDVTDGKSVREATKGILEEISGFIKMTEEFESKDHISKVCVPDSKDGEI